VEPAHTVIIGLPEPLKVRPITAGPALAQAALKPMQKWLWGVLKDESCFQLIGKTVSVDIVKQQLGRLGEDEEFNSGDYKASTDNLHSWVSECLLDELVQIWKEHGDPGDQFSQHIDDFNILMKRLLTGHSILDPEFNKSYRQGKDLKDEWFKDQKEGQLMGSIISFPFLCLANAAFCRWSMEITEIKNLKLVDRYRESYEQCRLLVNGDDCVFPGKIQLGFSNWEKVTSFGGLESSVGKTFRSRKFFTINSCQFSYCNSASDWEDDEGGFIDDVHMCEVRYVNFGLIYGQKKDGIRGKPFFRLGALHRDLHRTCPPDMFELASKMFIKNNSIVRYRQKRMPPGYVEPDEGTKEVQLEEDPWSSMKNAKVPWFLPEWLGGLGLVRTRKDQTNDWDLKIASHIRANMSSEFAPKKITESSAWRFHELVDIDLEEYKFLSNQNYNLVTFDETRRTLGEEYTKLYTLSVVDQLIHRNESGLVKFFGLKDQNERKCRSAHRHNVMLWETLRHDVKFGPLVASQPVPPYEDLLLERKEFSLACFDVRK